KAASLGAVGTAFRNKGLPPNAGGVPSAASVTFPGWAAEGLQQRAAGKVGRQLATGADLPVTKATIRLLGRSLPWTLKRPIAGSLARSTSVKTLSKAVRDMFAVTIDPSFKRAAMPGWNYENRLELPCPVCGEQRLDVFGADLTSKSGAPCRATAF